MSEAGEGGKGDPKPDVSAMRTLSEEELARAGRGQAAQGRQLQPGEVFAGRYTIEARIGEGGAGDVYRAVDARTKRSIALKLIRSDRLVSSETQARLMEEAATARDIRHPNVVAVYDADEFERQPFMTMEYLEGQTMRSWTRDRLHNDVECPFEAAVAVVSAILDGLEAAHAMGVIHRDLKPENVFLVRPSGEGGVKLKLLDFGLARVTGARTDSMGSAGTPHYMAPEQITAPDTVKPSADLYSLAVMFYELLVGVLPRGHWQPPSRGRSDIPGAVDALIEAALSNRPRSRPQSADEFRTMLKAATAETDAFALFTKAHALFKDRQGSPADFPEARRLFTLAAEKGSAAAMWRLGWMLRVGDGGEKDEVASRRWYSAAAERGEVLGMHNVAYMMQQGSGGPVDKAGARTWYEKAAKGGLAVSMSVYASMLLEGEGGPKDAAAAKTWFEKAIAAGYGSAMVQLGRMLARGDGVPADVAAGRAWLEKAQAGGEPGAEAELKRLEEAEKPKPAPQPAATTTDDLVKRATTLQDKALATIKKDAPAALAAWDEAERLFKQAVQTNDPKAKLAYAYFLGESRIAPHRKADNHASATYAKSAADDGLVEGMMRMGYDLMNGVWSPRDEAGAIAWFEKAGAAGSADGWREAGNMFHRPQDDPPNFVRAKAYWEKSAAMGDSSAMFQLGRLHGGNLWGQDTPKQLIDKRLAGEWFDRAEEAGYKKEYVHNSKKELGVA